MDSVVFTQEDGTETEYFVLAEATVGQNSYLLCTEEEEGDAEAFVLRAMMDEEDEESVLYETVEDEKELEKAVEAFSEILDDVDIEV